jgi:hypothetical protein
MSAAGQAIAIEKFSRGNSLLPSRQSIKRAALGQTALAGLAGLADFGHEYWTVGRFLEATDDAYVQADYTTVAPEAPLSFAKQDYARYRDLMKTGFGTTQRAEQIGEVLAWTGLPLLVLILLVPRLRKRFDARLIIAIGFALFAASNFMNIAMTTDYAAPQLLWPNVVRAIGQAHL